MSARRRKSDFIRDVLPVIDALVAFVPEGASPAPELQDQLDQRGHARWYPTAGGHQVKMPFQGTELPPGPFVIEPGGWDHDHCDQCEAGIYTGQQLWKTRDEYFIVICVACYEKLPPRPWRWPWQSRI